MNTSPEIELPEGRFNTLGWLLFSGACAGNELLHQLRVAKRERDALQAALELAQEKLSDSRDELTSMKSAAKRNAERILARKKKKR